MPSVSSQASEAGFALLGTLAALAILSAIALSVQLVTRDHAHEATLIRRTLEARIHADNAIIRAIAALGNPADPLHAVLIQPRNAYLWNESPVHVVLRVEHESGKIDINHADIDLISRAFRGMAFSPGKLTQIDEKLRSFRGSEEFIRSPTQVLTAADRLGSLGALVERVFTSATGARGIAPTVVTPEVFQLLSGDPNIGQPVAGYGNLDHLALRTEVLNQFPQSPWRPIFTIRAEISNITLPPLRRKAMVVFYQIPAIQRGHLATLFWENDNW